MTYPQDFVSTPDRDGDRLGLCIPREAQQRAAGAVYTGNAYVPRADIPHLIEWLQAHYAATAKTLPTAENSFVSFFHPHHQVTSYGILVDDEWLDPQDYEAWDDDFIKRQDFTVLYDAGKDA